MFLHLLTEINGIWSASLDGIIVITGIQNWKDWVPKNRTQWKTNSSGPSLSDLLYNLKSKLHKNMAQQSQLDFPPHSLKWFFFFYFSVSSMHLKTHQSAIFSTKFSMLEVMLTFLLLLFLLWIDCFPKSLHSKLPKYKRTTSRSLGGGKNRKWWQRKYWSVSKFHFLILTKFSWKPAPLGKFDFRDNKAFWSCS